MPKPASRSRSAPIGDPDADWSLPAWAYIDAEFLSVEIDRVIRPSWQIVCHVSELAKAGSWRTIEYAGESVIVIRGKDGVVRGFTNVCRHRGMRLLEGDSGCARALVCPYHAWTYGLDGSLTGVPSSADYPGLDKARQGLAALDLEIWRGFVFVRLDSGAGPSVAAMMQPYDAEIAPYRFEELRAIGGVRARERAVNWKNIGDNYSDGLHIPVAHAGLTRLFGKSYAIEAQPYIDKMSGGLVDRASDHPWERFYQRHLPRADHLPEADQRLWRYYKLWPNMAFDIYPDQIDFMQWLPVTPTLSVLREMVFALPDDRREMRLVRYANWRINRTVNTEDTWLISGVQQGMASKSFTVGPIGRSEVCLRSFAAKLRDAIPEARRPTPPPAGWSARLR